MGQPKIYLNTASCGLVPDEYLQSTSDVFHAMCSEGSAGVEMIRDVAVPRIRQVVADFIGAQADSIAFVPNFSYALSSIVQSLKGTERIMLCKDDYPSVLEPFRINNFDISWVESEDGFALDMDKLKDTMLQQKIDMVVMSHVKWLTGYKMDIADLGQFCKANEIHFIVDATQSMGAVHIDMKEVQADVLITSNYKWMNAGFGTGILYMSDSFLQKYVPVIGGHSSYSMTNGKWQYKPSIRSYEPGHLNFYGLLLLEAAVKHKQQIGMEELQAYNTRLTQRLLDNLGSFHIIGTPTMENRSSIVVIKDPGGLMKHLEEHNIVAISRDNNIRIGIHFYNTEADVDALLHCLQTFEQK